MFPAVQTAESERGKRRRREAEGGCRRGGSWSIVVRAPAAPTLPRSSLRLHKPLQLPACKVLGCGFPLLKTRRVPEALGLEAGKQAEEAGWSPQRPSQRTWSGADGSCGRRGLSVLLLSASLKWLFPAELEWLKMDAVWARRIRSREPALNT